MKSLFMFQRTEALIDDFSMEKYTYTVNRMGSKSSKIRWISKVFLIFFHASFNSHQSVNLGTNSDWSI